jgi:hypothetical protein
LWTSKLLKPLLPRASLREERTPKTLSRSTKVELLVFVVVVRYVSCPPTAVPVFLETPESVDTTIFDPELFRDAVFDGSGATNAYLRDEEALGLLATAYRDTPLL